MTNVVSKSCPDGNTHGQMRLVIHGPGNPPRWKNTMDYDAHAMTVVVPDLTRHGWKLEANDRLNRFDLYSPWTEALS